MCLAQNASKEHFGVLVNHLFPSIFAMNLKNLPFSKLRHYDEVILFLRSAMLVATLPVAVSRFATGHDLK
jgi:hypothetical protein